MSVGGFKGSVVFVYQRQCPILRLLHVNVRLGEDIPSRRRRRNEVGRVDCVCGGKSHPDGQTLVRVSRDGEQ